MAIELPELPYDIEALAPHISAETLEFHYGRHHAGYVSNLNKLIVGSELENASLEQIIKQTEGARFNSAAQIWNHTFYWNSMRPGGGGAPKGRVADAIGSAFGSYDRFRSEFTEAAMTQFGSGWAWLVDDGFGLRVMTTNNADLPLVHSATALLTIDVWEHAYYIDYRNSRTAYVDAFMDFLVNWDHVDGLLC